MKLLETEIRIFLAAFSLSLGAFFFMFAVGLPLVFEWRLLSSRLSSTYVASFFSGMLLYFLATGILSALTYIFVRNMRVESKIFIITFLTVFLATPGIFGTISLYYGNHVDPFWIITFWTELEPGRSGYILSFAIFFLLLISTVISGIIIILSKAYKILRKRKEDNPK